MLHKTIRLDLPNPAAQFPSLCPPLVLHSELWNYNDDDDDDDGCDHNDDDDDDDGDDDDVLDNDDCGDDYNDALDSITMITLSGKFHRWWWRWPMCSEGLETGRWRRERKLLMMMMMMMVMATMTTGGIDNL